MNKAKCFYKSCLHTPSRLKKSLVIEFSGEEGYDAGALKKDFFNAFLRHIENDLFEGRVGRLVPRNLWGHEF